VARWYVVGRVEPDSGNSGSNGEGLKQDDAEAIQWAAKAAEQGDKDALHLLGFIHCCRIPNTIPEDDVSLMMWFLLAKRAGDKKAGEFLAMLAAQMTQGQMTEADRRADAWTREHQSSTVK
jgi:TPR repeat protein